MFGARRMCFPVNGFPLDAQVNWFDDGLREIIFLIRVEAVLLEVESLPASQKLQETVRGILLVRLVFFNVFLWSVLGVLLALELL